ncbi:hypothetical protein CMI37_35445 [Candidatus Pacearchaeota archaeon]|nr:hypothetical protein [Candidatus Pacearchaeota archaeon]|tara:strand:- start:335 stop:556 length:222 start_codon:yes stop_codon:yes gene_type:complete
MGSPPEPKYSSQCAIDPTALFAIIILMCQKIQDLFEKLDADGGITDTDYESTLGFDAGDIQTRTSTVGRGVLL